MTNPDQPRPFRSLLFHFRPAAVPERTLRLSFTWGLGGIATVLLILLFGSGLLLKFVYEPVPSQAYSSILYLEQQVPFGQLLRNLHRWSGYGLLLAAFLHLLRVFYTGAFTQSRRSNWLIGLALFSLVVLSNFTGYLLPWDQVAYWAITISSSMLDYVPVIGSGLKGILLGGTEPGQTTLMNFYGLHTAILPALFLIALPYHFWRIRKADGLVIPLSPSEKGPFDGPFVATDPHLIVREVAMALLVVATVLLVSMWFDAPLAEQANPGLSPNPTKAPWFFMGLQELLMHFHPLVAVMIIPLFLLALVIALPWLDPSSTTAGVWFRSVHGRRASWLALLTAAAGTTITIFLNDSVVIAKAATSGSVLADGLVPLFLLLAVYAVFLWIVHRRFSASRSEMIQALFTLLLTSFIVLTIAGIWFRGAGMQLIWAGG